MEEQKKFNIAGKLFNPTAPYNAWKEFLPTSPSKSVIKEYTKKEEETPMTIEENTRTKTFGNRFYSMQHNSSKRFVRSPDRKVYETKPGSSSHTRQRQTISRQHRSQ